MANVDIYLMESIIAYPVMCNLTSDTMCDRLKGCDSVIATSYYLPILNFKDEDILCLSGQKYVYLYHLYKFVNYI